MSKRTTEKPRKLRKRDLERQELKLMAELWRQDGKATHAQLLLLYKLLVRVLIETFEKRPEKVSAEFMGVVRSLLKDAGIVHEVATQRSARDSLRSLEQDIEDAASALGVPFPVERRR